jgi:hypothetical protein
MSITFGAKGKQGEWGPALCVERSPKISKTPVVAPPFFPLLKLDLSDQVDLVEGAVVSGFLRQEAMDDAETLPDDLSTQASRSRL